LGFDLFFGLEDDDDDDGCLMANDDASSVVQLSWSRSDLGGILFENEQAVGAGKRAMCCRKKK